MSEFHLATILKTKTKPTNNSPGAICKTHKGPFFFFEIHVIQNARFLPPPGSTPEGFKNGAKNTRFTGDDFRAHFSFLAPRRIFLDVQKKNASVFFVGRIWWDVFGADFSVFFFCGGKRGGKKGWFMAFQGSFGREEPAVEIPRPWWWCAVWFLRNVRPWCCVVVFYRGNAVVSRRFRPIVNLPGPVTYQSQIYGPLLNP